MGNDRVSGAVEIPRRALQRMVTAKNREKNAQESDEAHEEESDTTEVGESTHCEH